MEREQETFDAGGFLDLLGALLDHEVRTGVLTVRIHVRDGAPWAATVRFDNVEGRAA